MKKIYKIFFAVTILIIILSSLTYFMLLKTGKYVFDVRTKQVGTMMEYYPSFFESIFNDIFPHALNCNDELNKCILSTREKMDSLSTSVVDRRLPLDKGLDWFSLKPSNQQPMYFITLLPNENIAKLFFSGGLVIEKIDTREERMVADFLENKRKTLYGPYFNEEAFETSWRNPQNRPFYDLKPSYLKDLYSQMEVIVPYRVNGETKGAVVYLHGQ